MTDKEIKARRGALYDEEQAEYTRHSREIGRIQNLHAELKALCPHEVVANGQCVVCEMEVELSDALYTGDSPPMPSRWQRFRNK